MLVRLAAILGSSSKIGPFFKTNTSKDSLKAKDFYSILYCNSSNLLPIILDDLVWSDSSPSKNQVCLIT